MNHRNKTPTNLHIIQIGFFSANSCFQKYGHVEVRFSDYSITSITRKDQDGFVHILNGRNLSSPNYRCFFEIAVQPHIEEEMINFANDYTKQFSTFTMYWNFLPILRNWPRRTGTFCSEYICNLLKICNLCEDLDSYTTSPDLLYETLRFDERVFCSRKNIFK